MIKGYSIRKIFAKVYIYFYKAKFQQQQCKFFTIIDSFRKWAETVFVPDKTKDSVISALFKNWIYIYRIPEILVSDNDKALCNLLFENILQRTGIKKLVSSSYHPTGNALIESSHRTLNRGFRNFYNIKMNV